MIKKTFPEFQLLYRFPTVFEVYETYTALFDNLTVPKTDFITFNFKKASGDRPLHISLRYDRKAIVRNTVTGGVWGLKKDPSPTSLWLLASPGIFLSPYFLTNSK